jgi:hypothetical protein
MIHRNFLVFPIHAGLQVTYNSNPMFEEKSLFYLAELLSYSTFYPRTSNPNILPANSSYYSIYLHMPFQSGFDDVLIFFSLKRMVNT